MPDTSPSVRFYANLQHAFDHFNTHLFQGELPPCLITMRASGRQFGYHHHNRFINKEGQMLDELGLHPGFFTLRPVEEVLSTLVHEMVHHWQNRLGQPSRSNPHNRQWAQKMRAIGLEPSSTGLPDGQDTGRHVSHYIHPDGLFLHACQALLAQGFELQWFDRHLPRTTYSSDTHQRALQEAGVVLEVSAPPVHTIAPSQPPSPVDATEPAVPQARPLSPIIPPPATRPVDRVRYTCPACQLKAWAKEGVDIHCGACEVALEPG